LLAANYGRAQNTLLLRPIRHRRRLRERAGTGTGGPGNLFVIEIAWWDTRDGENETTAGNFTRSRPYRQTLRHTTARQ